ncbi:DUF3237 domain-containing protein [Micromonospora harpali]|uniref:UPF0311 protein ACFPZ4_21455 n=1 Tax=Micromonospora harpali TaxID=1490225 RepID=A0ABW1HRJ8_9ACTN|nr:MULTISPECIES: DUF3237 domain-containing protein [unclassified Micromonospora]OON30616.1 hypothetical protein BSA16_15260 [Micromonospora sp. Rc5]
MDLEFEARCTAQLKSPLMVGAGPLGIRMVFQVVEGELSGPRIKARVVGAGADWVLVGSDNWARMDVRAQFETEDGAVLYAQYHGLIEMNDATVRALAEGTPTEFTDHYFRITPRLETGGEGYEWVNQALFVGQGRFLPGLGLEYEIYRIV